MSATSSTPSTAYALQEMATREEYQPIKGQSCKGTRLRMEERHSGTPYVAWSPASAEKPRIPIVGEDDQDTEGGCCNGFCAYVLVIVSVIVVIMFFPFSLFFLIKVSVPPL